MGVRRSGTSHARSEDEFRRFVSGRLDKKDVAPGAVEEGPQDFAGGSGAVVSEDSFFCDTPRDLDSGEARDLPQDLIEAGVVGRNGKVTVDVGDLSPPRWSLRWRHRSGRRCRGDGSRRQ